MMTTTKVTAGRCQACLRRVERRGRERGLAGLFDQDRRYQGSAGERRARDIAKRAQVSSPARDSQRHSDASGGWHDRA